MRVVQLVQGDVNLQILLRQRHVLVKLRKLGQLIQSSYRITHLERLVEVANLA